MRVLQKNDHIADYTVDYLIKQSEFNGAYKVTEDGTGTARFMKFFDREAMPENMFIADGIAREIALGKKVRHDHVLSPVDSGEIQIEGHFYQYLITDFFHGELLQDLIARGGPLPLETARQLMDGILQGLAHLHGMGLSHNDLTPRNILLEETGAERFTPRIIDLGHLSERVGGSPSFPVTDLNLLYTAPEALNGMFGPAADVFSAAAVFYTMLTGKAPWDCDLTGIDSYADRKRKVKLARKEPLDTETLVKAGADENLVNVICGALGFEQRLSLDDFTAGLGGKPVAARPAGQAKNPSEKDAPRKEQDPAAATKAQVEIRKAEGGGFSDVAGMEALKAELTNRVIWVLRDREKAEKYRLTPPNGMILYGPPGCGKTFFAQKFAEETHFNFVLVNGSDLGSIYLHGTQGKIADLFREAEKKAPTILCFDEFDSFVPSRSSQAAEHRPEEVNEFLGQLNNCAQRGIFVIGTTNRIDLIDPAVLRKGRMDLHVGIPAPDEKTRAQIFRIHLRNRPVADDIDYDALARETENYAASDIAFITNEAAMMAALADELIGQNHLLNAIRSNKSSLDNGERRKRIGF